MRSAEYETLVIKNSRSGNRTADCRAEEISNRLKHVVVKDFTEVQGGEIRQIPNTIVILGGDGTIQGSIAWLKAHDEFPTLIVAGGGTGNTFRKRVISEGATLRLTDITDSEKLAKASLSFRPAVINGEPDEEKGIFIIAAGFGEFERKYSAYREILRELPLPVFLRKRTSQLLSALTIGTSSADNCDVLIRSYSTDSTLHGLKIFPNENLSLNNENIGLVQITDRNPRMAIIKLAYAVSLWIVGVKPPPSIATTEIDTIFYHSRHQQGSQVTLDGEIRQMNGDKDFTIKRSSTEFPVVALV